MLIRILLSGFQFILNVVVAGFVIYYTYRAFIKANTDFNMEEAIKNGNTAVGILVSMNVYCASMMLNKSLQSVATMVKMYAYSPSDYTIGAIQIGLIAIAHLAITLFLAMLSISITLRLFGKMIRSRINAGQELQKGNVAIGILLACVVLVSTTFVSSGIDAMSKSMVPQPSIGQIEIME
jgi:uncharacterized membrane protein YjfL (UPF0719 family)